MTIAYINGVKITKEEAREYEIVYDKATGRVVRFRKREKGEEKK